MKGEIENRVIASLEKATRPKLLFAPRKLRYSYRREVGLVAATMGAAAGAAVGSHLGIAAGPLGAIAGTIPGAIIGGLGGYWAGSAVGEQVDRDPQGPSAG